MASPTREIPLQDPLEPVPLLVGRHTDASISDQLLAHLRERYGFGWWSLFLLALGLAGLFVCTATYTIARGIGVWGNNIPVAWAFGIINFVWWIGIGHAGTLISAILLLFQQKWRTSINRFAEAMTIFAVICAGIYPVLHLGRPWFLYWLIPYPSVSRIWPQFRSALVWDVFAVSTYFTVSLLFWYLGLIPDLATMRDSAKSRTRKVVYGIFALGWRGSARHWRHWRVVYVILAGIATPLVLSVHTVVSFDFATSLVPGWHSTVFPPYFVAGAVFSGFALVMTLIIPARKVFRFEHVITKKHLENMNKVMLATGWIVAYGYGVEHFLAWFSGRSTYENYTFYNREVGVYAPVFWLMIFCNVLTPQAFWFKKIRTSISAMWVISILINIGMWCERFVIIVASLHRDYLPSSWHNYYPTWVDWSIYIGTMGVFATLFLLFLRFLPPVAVAEVKELAIELERGVHGHPEPEPVPEVTG
jgi:Ni/Fe-hydrogenase subunit HybB-like protein